MRNALLLRLRDCLVVAVIVAGVLAGAVWLSAIAWRTERARLAARSAKDAVLEPDVLRLPDGPEGLRPLGTGRWLVLVHNPNSLYGVLALDRLDDVAGRVPETRVAHRHWLSESDLLWCGPTIRDVDLRPLYVLVVNGRVERATGGVLTVEQVVVWVESGGDERR